MQNSPKRSYAKYLMSGTGLAMLVAFAAPAAVQAQEAAAADDVTEVVVVGARAAQQSANMRKRTAKTAVDSIVADDVGAFPDKNLNEALSRVAGVALERDEYGDGSFITLRGNSPENIRVEMDGMGVQGGGMGATRSAELTTLPADLIKSVDVVKGSTADMTEGGLGGSVRIQTRTGLDFRKPYVSFRVGARHNSLGQKWQPDYNLIASRKFFDDRLGVLVSVTQTKLQNTTNGVENNQYGAGYYGKVDFDGSPEKTFTFNPATVYSPEGETRVNLGADTPFNNSTETPRTLVEKSAAAQTKADCYAAFPIITAGTGPGQSNTTGVRNQRMWELENCLVQWDDLLPSLPRQFDHTQYEDRFTADLRFDFRVNDRLTVFARYQTNERKVDRYFRERRLGGGGGTAGMAFQPGTRYDAITNPGGVWYTNLVDGVLDRQVAPGNTDYFRYDGVGAFENQPTFGLIVPIDPASVKVDENHFVTEYVANDQSLQIGERWEPFSFKTDFVQTGGTYRDGGLLVEFMAGKSKTDYQRIGTYTNRGFNYGSARFFIQPSGLWAVDVLTPYDQTDPSNYVQLFTPGAVNEVVGSPYVSYAPAYSVAQRAQVTRANADAQFNGWLSETEETTGKLDVTYNFNENIPFITTFKAGLNYRDYRGSFWSNPGGRVIRSGSPDEEYYLRELDPNWDGTGTQGLVPVRDADGLPVRNPDYVSPVWLPRAFTRSTIRACEEANVLGAEPCNFGFKHSVDPRYARDVVLTLTETEMRDLMGSSFKRPESKYFNDYEGAESLEEWMSVDARRIAMMMPNSNLDCMKTCVASDGNVYEQPYTSVQEKITSAYYMVEFEQELPLNLVFNGNVGLRVVETEAFGRGTLTVESIRVTDQFNPLLPNAAAGISRATYSENTSISKKTRDYLPSYNLNLWVMPDELVVRYYKGKNVSRQSITNMLPAGTCTVDERRAIGDIDGFDGDNGCTRIGNPGLKPLTAWNQNISVEWYPNRDTMFSFAKFTQDERIGGVIGGTANEYLLAGKGLTDPATGESLDNYMFSYPTWVNGPGYKREGWEFSSKTAFTFLPSYLRYLGADFNYSTVESEPIGASTSFYVNPNTGEVMPPRNEPKYFANLSLWYDDGRTNARISAQKKAEIFQMIEGDTSNIRNNYPFPGSNNTRPPVYRPGNPIFIDETLYVDAKITHKITPNVEVFAEARNVTKEARVQSDGGANSFADGTPYINALYYGGRSFSFGVTYRMGN